MASRLFAARHGGRCTDCDGPYDVGDHIAYDADDELVCAGCALGEPVARPARGSRTERMCGSCHMLHAGECDW